MRQITEEQAIAIIRENQKPEGQTNLGLEELDICAFKSQMEGREYAYLSEASVKGPFEEGADRIAKLLEVLKPEIDSIGKKPVFFQIQILFSPDAMLMMDEMNSMNDFIESYEDIEIKWELSSVEDETDVVKMLIITVTE